MGLVDRFARRVAAEITKAPSLPSGAVTLTEQQMGSIGQAYGNSNPLPRDTQIVGIPFSPGLPLIPGAINPINPDTGRADPRRYEYLVAQNINITETRLVSFKTLRGAADQIDILRRCIEVLKAKMMGLDWDIVLSDDAADSFVSERSGVSHVRAMSSARDQFTSEIARMRAFWKLPDPANGLVFADWLGMALEDILVIDALAVWPQRTVGGDLMGLQILDASTIKPLIDDRGMRPSPPNPAFQQILYGFPRTEFMATVETEDADGVFSSDELAYYVRNRRSHSVYGYSPTERALALASLYLHRQQWLSAEYTDGVLPEIMFKSDANFGTNAGLIAAWEDVLNDALAGQTRQRKRARIIPAGLDPVHFDGYGEKFKDTLDEYLVTSITGHFGVQPTEIGFVAKTGMGGASVHQGQAESSEVIGLVPLEEWTGRILSQLSYAFVGMPRELEFKFMASQRSDTEQEAKASDLRQRNGAVTINEVRSEQGKPLIDSPVADTPILVAGNSVFLVTPDGLVAAGGAIDDEGNASPVDESEVPAVPEAPPVPEVQRGEMRKFIRWLHKHPSGEFTFEHVPATYAATLNKMLATNDPDGARWYAEWWLDR